MQPIVVPKLQRENYFLLNSSAKTKSYFWYSAPVSLGRSIKCCSLRVWLLVIVVTYERQVCLHKYVPNPTCSGSFDEEGFNNSHYLHTILHNTNTVLYWVIMLASYYCSGNTSSSGFPPNRTTLPHNTIWLRKQVKYRTQQMLAHLLLPFWWTVDLACCARYFHKQLMYWGKCGRNAVFWRCSNLKICRNRVSRYIFRLSVVWAWTFHCVFLPDYIFSESLESPYIRQFHHKRNKLL